MTLPNREVSLFFVNMIAFLPLPFPFSHHPHCELDTRIIRNTKMIYCFTYEIDWNILWKNDRLDR